jgi:hypothetical protein
LGLGWHALALRKDWRGASSYALGGGAAGLPVGIALLINYMIRHGDGVPLPVVVVAAAFYLALGAGFMAVTMWLVWLMRRPTVT